MTARAAARGDRPRPRALVWTRAREDWARDRPLLEAALTPGVALVHLPAIEIVPALFAAPTGSFDAAVILSVNALTHALASDELKAALKTIPAIYTHGAATAAALRAAGLNARHIAGCETAVSLSDWLVPRLPQGARVLWPTAADPAHDLAASLGRQGAAVVRIDLYRTEVGLRDAAGAPLTPDRLAELRRTLAGAVCFASPSAVRGFAPLLADSVLRQTLTAVTIGPTTAMAAQGSFDSVLTANAATIEALVGTGAWTAAGKG